MALPLFFTLCPLASPPLHPPPPASCRKDSIDIEVHFDGRPGQANVDSMLQALKPVCTAFSMAEPKVVPWFPTRINDIDQFSTKTLDAGAELEGDHPGFHDKDYRERRRWIVAQASTFKHGQEIPRVSYTPAEVETWGVVYDKLTSYTGKFAVQQYNEILPLMEKHCGYAKNNIPQLQDISDFLKSRTGFTLRPVGGLLSARDFLNALAYRVFFSTQYIRHHSVPLYTPEPDIVHELMGHAPMFADPDFADFSHEIGLASLGASDEDIKRLATCYWFSVEFGLAMQEGKRKAYGAGLLSSFGELEYSCADYRPAGGTAEMAEYRPWNPSKAAVQEYPITKYQPVYYVAESLADAKQKMREFCEKLQKGFHVTYDQTSHCVAVDKAIIRGKYTVTLQTGSY